MPPQNPTHPTPALLVCIYLKVCSQDVRRRTPGIFPGYWFDFFPSTLEWHWAAGLNMSDCSPAVVPGDWNGPFTRLRLLSALRMLEEAARHGAADTELVLCANEVLPNAGDWCLQGEQPIFGATRNEERGHATIAMPHWMPRLRDYDFSVWEEVRAASEAEHRQDAKDAAAPGGVPPAARAVFRGGVYRLATYSSDWRRQGTRRTAVTKNNYVTVGRTALLRSRDTAAGRDALDLNLGGFWGWAKALSVNALTMSKLDTPQLLSMENQSRSFQYIINAEGHGGWADRLYQLLLSPQLVLAQDLPFRLWYEGVLAVWPGRTHLPLHSSLANLTDAVRWARSHPAEVSAMVGHANAATNLATSVAGIRYYVQARPASHLLTSTNISSHRLTAPAPTQPLASP